MRRLGVDPDHRYATVDGRVNRVGSPTDPTRLVPVPDRDQQADLVDERIAQRGIGGVTLFT